MMDRGNSHVEYRSNNVSSTLLLRIMLTETFVYAIDLLRLNMDAGSEFLNNNTDPIRPDFVTVAMVLLPSHESSQKEIYLKTFR